MIYSDDRKLALSGWLKEDSIDEYLSPLKLQKFLFFYEAMSKLDNDNADFSHLRGYERGPVFSQVWGDYTKERSEFNTEASKAYQTNTSKVNSDRAKICSFIVKVFTEKELSDITHVMNIWKSKEERILSREYQVNLDEKDFNDDDKIIVKNLKDAFPIEFINNSYVIRVENNNFIISKDDEKRLKEEHLDTLYKLSKLETLENPVYTYIDDEGVLVVD